MNRWMNEGAEEEEVGNTGKGKKKGNGEWITIPCR